MPPDVSVVVPFFNPGANIDDCISSLLSQTLPRDRFEIVLVDDGSTDGSPARVERHRSEHPDLIRVERIAASGWPGKPRNTGIDLARGTFIQFVDSDDALNPRALQRLLEVATSSEADVVVGKLSSDFRNLNHPIYRHTVTSRTLGNFPLVESLTPHKMFRRALLLDKGIRFAEGPRHVEDEHFCMQAYTNARSVAVVGDLNCYYYRRRRSAGRNLGDIAAVPSEYYADLAEILDVIDRGIPDPADRIPVQRRFYRVEMLGRLRGRAMLDYPDDYRRQVLAEVGTLATTRFDPAVQAGLPVFIRTQSRLMLDADADALVNYARFLESLRLRATTAPPVWRDGRLLLHIDARLYADDDPFRFAAEGDGWAVPATVAPNVGLADRVVTPDDLTTADVDCATVSRADAETWSTTDGLALTIEPDGGVTIRGEVAIDPTAVMGGQPLAIGLWDIRLRLMFGGLTRASPLRPRDESEGTLPAWIGTNPTCVTAYWTAPSPTVALDVDEWAHPLHDLVADIPEVRLRGRRVDLTVPEICGEPARHAAQLLLEPADAGHRVTVCPAHLIVTPDGSRIRARLPRRGRDAAHWRLWVRIGTPGGPAARPLGVEVRRDRRRYQVGETP
jgi:glycosyltransferase involved in cell wall biosynthesis